ncbi:MAG: DUF45 domain-containing protein, partial [Erysipelotrichaceae bacterium]|nr:DUF45 domain-containing protein [Erysipelotrichaceae bacterium]
VQYVITRKPRVRTKFWVDGDGIIQVVTNLRVPESEIVWFLTSKRDWLIKQRRKMSGKQSLRPRTDVFRINGKEIPIVWNYSARMRYELSDTLLAVFCKYETEEERLQVVETICKKLTEKLLEQLRGEIEGITEEYGIVYSVKQMRTRWGSCTPAKRKMSFNSKLIGVPVKAVKYIMIHEYAHLKVPDHSTRFYDTVACWMPSYRQQEQILKQYGL